MRAKSGMSFGVTFFHGLAAVARHLHVAVVGAGPDQVARPSATARARRRRRRSRRRFRRLVIGPPDRCIVRRIVTRQVRADPRPALAFVRRLPDVLRRDVEHVRIGRRVHDRERPLKPLDDVLRRIAHRVVGIRIDFPQLAGFPVEAGDQAAVAAGEEDVGVARIVGDVAALAAADRIEDAIGAAVAAARPAGRLARHARRAVVLLRAADVIRNVGRRDHVVELRRRARPGRSTSRRRSPTRSRCRRWLRSSASGWSDRSTCRDCRRAARASASTSCPRRSTS